MDKYTVYLKQLLNALSPYSRQGIVNLALISVKYRNILEEIASTGRKLQVSTKTLKATADAIKLSVVQIDVLSKNDQKKTAFEKARTKLAKEIRHLLSLIETYEVENNP